MVGGMKKTMKSKVRIERDSMGERTVPEEAWYGAQTSRSMENFPFGEEDRLPMEVVRGMALVKAAAADANFAEGRLQKDKAEAIAWACGEVMSGRMDGEFALPVYQAGSGTSSHMNLNEVVANLANVRLGGKKGSKSPVHPNDDVNMGQSTNNTFPSGAKVAAVLALPGVREALDGLAEALKAKGKEFAKVVKSGRTHLQDAVPVTLGQEFAAWGVAVAKASARLGRGGEALLELGAGGNAVGTGVNTGKAFRKDLIAALNRRTGQGFRVAEDGLQATQFLTDFAALSGAVRCAALDIQQIANNLRLLASGPNTGIGEISLPAVEPGSSIMPGKVNPSVCEAVNMAMMQIQGLDHAVALACGAGQLELNTHMPLVAADVLRELELLERAAGLLAEKCVAGIEARAERCRANLERSAGLPTILNPRLGYDRVAGLVKEGLARGMTLKELALEKGLLTEEEYGRLVAGATGPNLGK